MRNHRGLRALVCLLSFVALLVVQAAPADAAISTVLVKNINTSLTGGGEGEGPGDSHPSNFTTFGDHAFFTAYDETNGHELWRTDGTTNGTTLLKDLRPGSDGSFPTQFTVMGSTMYFRAFAAGSYNLWKSDGTSDGTVIVPETDSMFDPAHLTVVGDTLFFVANDGTSQEELYKVDNSGNVVKIEDITPPGGGYSINNLTDLNGILMFAANDGTVCNCLWRSDGTAAGTFSVEDIDTTGFHDNVAFITKLGNHVYFEAQNDSHYALYRADGTVNSAEIVAEPDPDGFPNINSMHVSGSTLYFSASSPDEGYNLWATDGTTLGTHLVKDINPGDMDTAFTFAPANMGDYDGDLFFGATDGTNGMELWRTDGSAENTVMVKDIFAGNGGDGPQYLTTIGDTLFFTASDGTNGCELWSSDGSSDGTSMVSNINPNETNDCGHGPNEVAAFGSMLLFSADDGANGRELWKTASPPDAPTFSGSEPSSGSDDNEPQIQGTAPAGSTVNLYFNDDCVGSPAATGTPAAFADPGLTVTVTDDTTTSIYGTVTDANGTSACAGPLSYEEITPPLAPTVSSTSPGTGANDNDPEVVGTAPDGSTVNLYTSDLCTGTAAGTGAAAQFAAPGITVHVIDDTTTTFYATATDDDGTSPCSSTSVTYQEVSPSASPPSLTINDVSGNEGDAPSTMTFTITASHPRTSNFKVSAKTVNGTAKAPDDFTAFPLTVFTFTPGQTTKTVNIPIVGDNTDEDNETFTVKLSDPVGSTIGDNEGTGAITEDADAKPVINIGDVTKKETDDGSVFKFAVSLNTISGKEITVDFATADGTAGQPKDYAAKSGTLTFAAGTKDLDIAVSIKVGGDGKKESDETFFVNLSNPNANATIGDAQAVGTIKNDD